ASLLRCEYNMQRSWREDDEKYTFIILNKQRWMDSSLEEEQCMVGDVNIFLTDPTDPSLAELEIMIAEASYRGKGIGKEVTRMMMSYGKFQAKIGLDSQLMVDKSIWMKLLDDMAHVKEKYSRNAANQHGLHPGKQHTSHTRCSHLLRKCIYLPDCTSSVAM
uniref:N-acetyltransferase domain-containing protein n=1 Tax=Amphiprion percula TaxID=161767 RepID=A0A3P8TIB6_AMPPE